MVKKSSRVAFSEDRIERAWWLEEFEDWQAFFVSLVTASGLALAFYLVAVTFGSTTAIMIHLTLATVAMVVALIWFRKILNFPLMFVYTQFVGSVAALLEVR